MSHTLAINDDDSLDSVRADCNQCFGLCCTALPFAKSADFTFDKDGGTPCTNLRADYRCGIHQDLREKGLKGCTVYECFGAGQKVSQVTYKGEDWRSYPATAEEMFAVFPIVQQIQEMLWYLHEALALEVTTSFHNELRVQIEECERLTRESPENILRINVPELRANVNKLLILTSERVRSQIQKKKSPKKTRRSDFIGANLKGADLAGADLRGALLIAADLRGADMRVTDLIGADLRDADVSGADLTGCIFLTQVQVNAAKGDSSTKLPSYLKIPAHWVE
ncbi:hypothetical protein J45TS6_30580 [Paenibacillus sp. J45TS6]|uniref:pentapeptide repeat-containing protein n=1 Tax=Paenibacillus sp. J45TS6 TaxID=2807196 RepID=UPI001B01C5DB|nr:pentapeptide repeat-containing protein [Paenibacillus sp. J45TS6]GIP44599.1 hypothetical protein J45TS6_30580 [Paenibacillus sp. J45TS6]